MMGRHRNRMMRILLMPVILVRRVLTPAAHAQRLMKTRSMTPRTPKPSATENGGASLSTQQRQRLARRRQAQTRTA